MEKLYVSIIIPAYNVEKYITRCLESVSVQTYSNFEAIVINDGSSDGTLELVQKFVQRDSRFKLINQENKGLSGARNMGLKIAKGQYITFIDSDDWVHYDYLKSMVEVAVKTNADIVSVKETVTDREINMQNEAVVYKIYNKRCADCLFKIEDSNYAWGKLIQRKLFDGFEVFFSEGRHYEDIGSMYKLYDKCRILACIKNKYYYYYMHQGSITSVRNLKDVNDKLFFVAEMKDYALSQEYKYWGYYILVKLFGVVSDLNKIQELSKEEHRNYLDKVYAFGDDIKIPFKILTFDLNGLRVLLLKMHMADKVLYIKKKLCQEGVNG
ncbi:MAG: glycosyltransferase [Clostridium sp.]|nr:glycosyltransferase [Clostridium sp.]